LLQIAMNETLTAASGISLSSQFADRRRGLTTKEYCP
jgi:hypothetical protein